jgi:hypothetical protein
MTRVKRWERRTDVPLILLALAFLVAYAVPVIHPDLDPGLLGFFDVVSWTVWAAFALDFVIRLGLADKKMSYAIRHWYDVALIALPLLRPLRLLRLVALFRSSTGPWEPRWPGERSCTRSGRRASLCSWARSRCSTLSGSISTRTSRTSAMPCGGRRQPWRPWAMATSHR